MSVPQENERKSIACCLVDQPAECNMEQAPSVNLWSRYMQSVYKRISKGPIATGCVWLQSIKPVQPNSFAQHNMKKHIMHLAEKIMHINAINSISKIVCSYCQW